MNSSGQDASLLSARLGKDPEDFVVSEIPAYEPSGEGDHLYAWIRKRGHNTVDVVRRLSRELGVKDRDAGYAGMKDRHAVTYQWLSFPLPRDGALMGKPISDYPIGPLPEPLAYSEGIWIHALSRHRNKLRTGHLHGNSFQLTLTGRAEGDLERAEIIRARLVAAGLPNRFSAQRFGRGGNNLVRALEMLTQGAATGRKSRFDTKLLSSTVQAAVFNRYLERRLAMKVPLLRGEVVRLEGTAKHFVVTDPDNELARLASGDIHLTGPLLGPKTVQSLDEALALEQEVVQELGLGADQLLALAQMAPGARRDLSLKPKKLEVEPLLDSRLKLSFELPSGAYATEVLAEFTGESDPRELRSKPADPA